MQPIFGWDCGAEAIQELAAQMVELEVAHSNPIGWSKSDTRIKPFQQGSGVGATCDQDCLTKMVQAMFHQGPLVV